MINISGGFLLLNTALSVAGEWQWMVLDTVFLEDQLGQTQTHKLMYMIFRWIKSLNSFSNQKEEKYKHYIFQCIIHDYHWLLFCKVVDSFLATVNRFLSTSVNELKVWARNYLSFFIFSSDLYLFCRYPTKCFFKYFFGMSFHVTDHHLFGRYSTKCVRKELFCDGRINCAWPYSEPAGDFCQNKIVVTFDIFLWLNLCDKFVIYWPTQQWEKRYMGKWK